jgi:hypothetical protein
MTEPVVEAMVATGADENLPMAECVPEYGMEGAENDGAIQLNRQHFAGRLHMESKLRREGPYCLLYIAFFILYLTTVGTFQQINNISEVHQTLAVRFTKGLDTVTTVESVMNYLQHFIETSYEMASALIDANTMNDIDPNRCFDGDVGDVCRLSFWSVPLIDRTKASWVNITRITLDRIGQNQVSQSFWNNCEMRLCDWATTPCGGNQTRVFPEFKSINYKVQDGDCLYLPFHLDPGAVNATTFGLTPEDPMILDSLRDFPYKSVVPLSPVVYQQRAETVPCVGFGTLYNDDVLGAGFCTPEAPCDPNKVTSFTASRNNPYTERQQRIYIGYVEAAFPCGDSRLEDTADFMDKSWFPAAGFRHLTEGKACDRGLIDSKNVFYKFTSDAAYLQQPLNGSQQLCSLALKTMEPDELGVPGPGLTQLQRCMDCVAGDLETPGGRACHVYGRTRVATRKVLALSPTEIVTRLVALSIPKNPAITTYNSLGLVPPHLRTLVGAVANPPAIAIYFASNETGNMTLADFDPYVVQQNFHDNFTILVNEVAPSVTQGEKNAEYSWMGTTIGDPMQNRAHEMWCDGESGVEGCHFKALCLSGGIGYPADQCDLRSKQAEFEDAAGYAISTSGRRLWSQAYLSQPLADRRNTFVSLSTRELTIMALVITPQGADYEDIATLARVTFKFTQHGSIKGYWEAVSVSQLAPHWQGLCLGTLVVSVIYLGSTIRLLYLSYKRTDPDLQGIQKAHLVDLLASIAAPVHLIITYLLPEFPSNEMMAAFAANDQTKYFSTMAYISWAGTEAQLVRQIGSIIAYILFIRLVCWMALHPRIGTMVDTLATIADDVVHFMITSMALFSTLAFQAFWSFGMNDSNFESFSISLWTQFKMIVGDFPFRGGGLQSGFQGLMQLIYLLIFTFLVFFVLLNFFLAIVVEAFSANKAELKKNRSENPFFVDIIEVFWGLVISLWKKYPPPNIMRKYIQQDLEQKLMIGQAGVHPRDIDFATYVKMEPVQPNAVTASELYNNAVNATGEKCFQSEEHAKAYIKFYGRKVHDKEGWGLMENDINRRVGGVKPLIDTGVPKVARTIDNMMSQVSANGFAVSGGAVAAPQQGGPSYAFASGAPNPRGVLGPNLQAQINSYSLEVARLLEGMQMLSQVKDTDCTDSRALQEIRRVEAHVRGMQMDNPQGSMEGDTSQMALAIANTYNGEHVNGGLGGL